MANNSTTPNYRVSLGFAALSDGALDEFTTNVITSMTGNAAFPNPPVPLTPPDLKIADGAGDLTSLQSAFQDAIAAAAQGGKQTTAAKNEAREALLDGLRKDAAYVQTVASHDLALLLSSGYQAASTNRAQAPLDKPVIVRIDNETSTQLVVRLDSVPNARSYQIRMNTTGNGTWQDAGTYTQARRIVLTNLTPGTTYTIEARAIGGSTGYSDWSDPVSHMAT